MRPLYRTSGRALASGEPDGTWRAKTGPARRSSVLAVGMLATTASEACTLQMIHRPRRVGRAAAQARLPLSAPLAGMGEDQESKFKLLAIIVPPHAIDASDRDLALGKGIMS